MSQFSVYGSARTLRRAVAGISALALLALPSIAQTDIASAQAAEAPIISADRMNDGEAMNYAIVLSEETSSDELNTLIAYVDAQGNKSLGTYPHLHLFFAQSAKKDFATSVATYAAEQGISLHSVGPTRTKVITDDELVVADAGVHTPAGITGSSQAEKEAEEWNPDPLTKLAWGLHAIGAIEAQKVDVPRADVLVGVLDTGVDGDHPDLAGQIDEDKSVSCGHNGIPDTSRAAWQDIDRHGTHVAGTIAAGHNGVGVDSVAPHVKIAAVRASNADGFFYPEYVTCAFNWAVDQGFDVTNNSYYVDPWAYWIPTESTQAAGYESVRRAIAYAYDNGVLNIAAAGNSAHDLDNPSLDDESPNDVEGSAIFGRNVTNGIDIPTMLPNVVRVSAVGQKAPSDDPATGTLIRADFSNYGETLVTVAAPGVRIASTVPGGRHSYLNGTSMASPHVAGVAAILKSIHPEATPAELTELLKKHAQENYARLGEPAGKEYRGAGLVNALAAVLKDQPQPNVGVLEFSTDGQEWAPVEGPINVRLYPQVQFRVVAQGPTTVLNLTFGTNAPVVATSENPFGETLTVTAPLDLKALYADKGDTVSVPVNVTAQGRNKDERADDDITVNLSIDLIDAPVVPHPEELQVSVSAPSVEVSKQITFTATGFAQGEEITFTVHSNPVVAGTVVADQDGRASLTWDVPADFEVSEHTVIAAGAETKKNAQAVFTVTAAPKAEKEQGSEDVQNDQAQSQPEPQPAPEKNPQVVAPQNAAAKTLASTGAQAATILAIALLVVAGGVGALVWKRRSDS